VFEEVRVKRNLSYAPDAFLRGQSANTGGLYVTAVDGQPGRARYASTKSADCNASRSPGRHQRRCAQFLTTYYISQETNAAQTAELAQYELIGGGWRNSLMFLEKLRAVTPANVQRVSQKYMRNIRFVVLGNPQQIDKNIFIGQAGS